MSNEPKAGPGVDPEMLAAYIENKLSPEQRAAVEAQLAADPDSYAVLVESMKTIEALESSASPQVPAVPAVSRGKVLPFRRWVIATGSLAAAAAIALAVVQPEWLQRMRGVNPQFARLVTSVGGERYFEARMTGGFEHVPLAPVARAPQTSRMENLGLVAVAGQLQRLAEAEPNADNLHAWGVAQLLLGQLDGAIVALSTAARQTSDKAVLSDLAAAYVTRAVTTNPSEDWPRALEAASRAIEGETHPRPEALFNLALAAESLNLRQVAEQYWTAYIAAESQAEWRAEGAAHLERLRAQPPQSWFSAKPGVLDAAARADHAGLASAIERHSQRIRELVEDELLPSWADDVLAGKGTATSVLLISGRLAASLATKTGDDLLARSVRSIEAGDQATQLRIAAGLHQYSAGRQLYDRAAMQDSVQPFSAAKVIFDRDSVPLSEWCELYLATAAYYRADYPSSLASIDGILTRTKNQSWWAVAARTYWLQGLIATQRAEYDRSLALYTKTLGLFERLAESENQAAVHSLLATALLYLGDDENVWLHTVRALQSSNAETTPRRQHMILTGAINRAIRLELPESALAFADQAAAVNAEWNDPIARVEIANYRARTLLALDRSMQARAEVDLARKSLDRVIDRGLRQRAEAEVMQTEADVLAAADPVAGVAAATRAIDYFSSSRSALRVPRLYLARAAARRRLGDTDGAVEDLRQGASSFDAERKALPRSERLRLAYSDEVWMTYRQLVAAEIDRGGSCQDVLTASARARSSMLSIPTAPGDAPLTFTSDRRRALLAYAFVDGRVAIMIVRGGHCDLRLSAFSSSRASIEIAAMRSSLAGVTAASEEADRANNVLFANLLAPIWPLLDGVQELELVADGPLHYLPFAALRLPNSLRLIEAMSIRMLPDLGQSSSPAHAPGRALVSAGGRANALSLPPLPGASAEANAVADLLKSVPMRIDGADSATAFLHALKRTDVVHFAGHAVVNEEYPLLSRLILAGSGNDEWVTADQIASNGTIGARLVFLSACSTQSGRQFGGEGPASLARSFLVAGAGDVVASLWPVADHSTPQMVAAFYQQWIRSGDAAQALRQAAIQAIREGKSTPEQWAAWVVIGRSRAGETATTTAKSTIGD